MNTVLIAVAFALGAAAIGWIGTGFLDGHTLALGVTIIIGGAYLVGGIEMLLFRRATSTLTRALKATDNVVTDLDNWMNKIHGSLQSSVRARIEGDRIALPGASLTPYLLGLLVMLGMLGTFAGMVVTLNGAVIALESTTDLQAIRESLAAPIKGLGLAFGTSVAGVAASAMLGLISTLSRRERVIASQLLDKKISNRLCGFSAAHHREATFKAMQQSMQQSMQQQANALPEVVEKLSAMASHMERLGNNLNDKLLANQDRFQSAAQTAFSDLARSVEQSLKTSLAESSRLAGESLKPVLVETMSSLAQASQQTQAILLNATQTQLEGFSERFHQMATNVAVHWQHALESHERSNDALLNRLDQSLQAFNGTLEGSHRTLLSDVRDAANQWHTNATTGEQQRLSVWQDKLSAITDTLTQAWKSTGEQTQTQQQHALSAIETLACNLAQAQHTQTHQLLSEMTQLLSASETLMRQRMTTEENWIAESRNTQQQLIDHTQSQLQGFAERIEQSAKHLLHSVQESAHAAQQTNAANDQQRLTQWTSTLETLAATLKSEWQQAGEHTLTQQRALCATLETTAQQLTEQAHANASQLIAEITPLLNGSEQLLQSRLATESAWLQQHSERMDQLTQTLRGELNQLRDEEATRGQAAVEQLATLQSALATHLSTLGASLEAPMTRLIETASEAPRAAAEVIAQLRTEIANTSARDNEMLVERQRLMEHLQSLMESLNQAASEQRSAIDKLIATSTEQLNNVSHELTQQVAGEAGKLTEIASQVTGSAVEVSSLSEAFGFAVQRFAETNEKLIDNLHRIETALDKSSTRSDEQLAYYVAQAREIIDLSTLSQKEIFEELRQLKTPHEEAEVS